MSLTKVCTKCGLDKPLTEYHRDEEGMFGRRPDCKSCRRQEQVLRYQSDREAILAKNKITRGIDKEAKSLRRRAKYAADPQPTRDAGKRSRDKKKALRPPKEPKILKTRAQVCADYVARNADTVKASKAAWKSKNPAAVLADTRHRQAIKRNALCECCQTADGKANMDLVYALAKTLKMHVDHIRPLSKGGAHCLHNLQFLTPLDNMRKGAKWQEAA